MTTATDPRPSPHLPLPLTGLVGRERETAELRALLAPGGDGPRLVTLTGVGGVGKTRLALAAAHALAGAYPDGARFVELAPLADPAFLAPAVAAALGVREQPARPLIEQLVEELRPRAALLVLDNCEHLVDAAARLAEALLAACPDLRLLATSREALRLPGEVVWPVPPLATPDPAQPPPLDTLAGYPAVRLFLTRARAQQPGFALTERNAPAVAALCRRLDGIPLAIELAAARVRALPLTELAARLGDALRLLSGGSRTAPARHQTLRATLDWSYRLLGAGEQALFRRLAVFAGGCTLAAIEAVAADDEPAGPGEPIIPTQQDVLGELEGLIDKSLVLVDHGGAETRYWLLEPVRQYAMELLGAGSAGGEAAATRRRHATYYMTMAEALEPILWGAGQATALAPLTADHDNLRVALRWALDEGDLALGLRLGGAMWRFWLVRGHVQEGRRWLAALLAAGRDQPAALLGKALNGAGVLAQVGGDAAAAVALYEEALPLRRRLGDKRPIAGCLINLGSVLADQGDFTRAVPLLREALGLSCELGNVAGIALALDNLGRASLLRGDCAEAIALLEESVARCRGSNNGWGLAIALIHLGDAMLESGDVALARARQAEGLALAWADDDRLNVAYGLEGMARVAGAQRSGPEGARRAAQLYGAAEALREAIGATMPPIERARHQRHVAAVRAKHDADAFAAAWAAGRALSLHEAVALAQQPPTPPEAVAPPRPAGVGGGDAPAGLTPREVDVLRLIARGLANQQVADALYLSVRTVERHIANLYGKLGVRHRGDAVAAAFRLGLAPPETPESR